MRLRTYLAAVMVAVFMSLFFVPAASAACTAGSICGKIYHRGDAGYDRAFTVECNYGGTNRYVYEGRSSTSVCSDLARIYVASGQEIWCLYSSGWAKKWDGTGWYNFNDFFNDGYGCESRAD